MKKNKSSVKPRMIASYIVFIVLISFFCLVGFILYFYRDSLFLPNNSITISLEDEVGDPIDALIIEVIHEETDTYYNYEFIDDKKTITVSELDSGSYRIYLRHIPVGYFCKTRMEVVKLEKNGKLNLNYTCEKEK